ncbi:MAG TPA: hypothetical protein VD996_09100 [Chitinophagaceae bacterium]|nr:hypothetical protein [Chitinophagaceae bacterium]
MNIKTKPYHLLLFAGIVFVLLSFFANNQNNTLDLHLHDTYYIIATMHVLWALAFLALLTWTLYTVTSGFLYSKVLTWAHVGLTLVTLLFLTWAVFFGNVAYSGTIAVVAIILLLTQLVFFVNFFGGVFKRTRR